MDPYKLLGWVIVVGFLGVILFAVFLISANNSFSDSGDSFCSVNGFDGFAGNHDVGYYCYSYINSSVVTADIFNIGGLWYLSSEVVSS